MRIIQTSIDLTVKDRSYGLYTSGDIDQGRLICKRMINFAICDSCHWVASCLNLDRSVVTCPNCGDNRLECMPPTDAESHTFDTDDKRGTILKFHNGSDKAKESLHG